MSSGLKVPIFLALDLDSEKDALSLAKATSKYVGGFKVGPQLVLRSQNDLIPRLSEWGRVFLDMKFHDIPNTMKSAVRAGFDMGASYVTVHASAGSYALQELSKLEAELNQIREFRLLAVTLLTSFTPETLPPSMQGQSIDSVVEKLATLSLFNGVRGLVCSPLEVASLRKKFPQAFLVTPGIRRKSDNVGDQSRTMGPAEAIQLGSSAIVVGRPILHAPKPIEAAQEIYEEIQALTSN